MVNLELDTSKFKIKRIKIIIADSILQYSLSSVPTSLVTRI
jgi:hypothetical protein